MIRDADEERTAGDSNLGAVHDSDIDTGRTTQIVVRQAAMTTDPPPLPHHDPASAGPQHPLSPSTPRVNTNADNVDNRSLWRKDTHGLQAKRHAHLSPPFGPHPSMTATTPAGSAVGRVARPSATSRDAT